MEFLDDNPDGAIARESSSFKEGTINEQELREQIANEIEQMDDQPCPTCAILRAAEIARGQKWN